MSFNTATATAANQNTNPYLFNISQHAVSTEKEIFVVSGINIPSQMATKQNGGLFSSLSSYFGVASQIAKNLLPSSSANEQILSDNKQKKELFISLEWTTVHEFNLKIEDPQTSTNNATINGTALFLNPAEKQSFIEKKAQDQKWIIHFIDNKDLYESNLLDFQDIGRHYNANILVFNPRGVGESVDENKENLNKPEHLVADGEACVRYLFSKGAKEENMIVQGHALGGTLAIRVAGLHGKIGLIAINTFGKLSSAASSQIPFSGDFLAANGWEYDSVSAFKNIKADKLIVYHKQDGVVPYHVSLYKMLKENIKLENPALVEKKAHKGRLKDRLKAEFKPAHVQLAKDFGGIEKVAHKYHFSDDAAYPKIVEFIKGFFKAQLPL